MLKATFDALGEMRAPRSVAAKRGKKVGEIIERRDGTRAEDKKEA
jgi:small subunit ribosomal protein S5